MSRLAYCLRFLTDPAQAEERAREALRLADELEHPFSLAYALLFTTWLAIDLGDQSLARERAQRMTSLVEEQQLGFLQPMGTVLRGWMLAEDGQTKEAIGLIREGLDAYTPSSNLYQPYCLALLARVCLSARMEDDARAALLEAFELTERLGQRFLEADLHLLMGELTLASGGDRAQAESHYSSALEVARRQGATPLAHRATESLERLRAVSS
jgi:tetratricopeptide (TPR) repeat protein